MREEEGSKERWSKEKWKKKWIFYERRKIKRTMITWNVKWEFRLLLKKKNQKNDDKLICEKRSGIIKRKKDQNNDSQLTSEKWNAVIMREEGSKNRWWIDKKNGNLDYYERRRRINRTMIKRKVKREMFYFWEKKKDKNNYDKLKSEKGNALIRREEVSKERW
jgi:hypothetical protein